MIGTLRNLEINGILSVGIISRIMPIIIKTIVITAHATCTAKNLTRHQKRQQRGNDNR